MRSRRRFIASSSDYKPPMPEDFEQDILHSLQLLQLLENPALEGPVPSTSAGPTELARMLSVKSVVSTTSSFAAKQAQAQVDTELAFRKIGAGICGVVLAVDGQSVVYKISKAGTTEKSKELRTDYDMHQRILSALRHHQAEVEIPHCFAFIGPDDNDWWSNHQSLRTLIDTEKICNLPAPVLVTERILPLPAPIREHLITSFCPEHLRSKVLEEKNNQDCLIRVYLGSDCGKLPRTQPQNGPPARAFTLRNFQLHVNQMVEIRYDFEGLAVAMGQALAIMHWAAQTDARDVEFVLGSSTTTIQPTGGESVQAGTEIAKGQEDFKPRETRLFVLDFNQVQDITMDDAGVEKAVDAFYLNDKYYPRPGKKGKVLQELWNSFVRSYIATADEVLGECADKKLLPRKFILGVRNHAKA